MHASQCRDGCVSSRALKSILSPSWVRETSSSTSKSELGPLAGLPAGLAPLLGALVRLAACAALQAHVSSQACRQCAQYADRVQTCQAPIVSPSADSEETLWLAASSVARVPQATRAELMTA